MKRVREPQADAIVAPLEQDVCDPVRELVHLAERQRLVPAEDGGAVAEAACAAADQLGNGHR